MHPCARSSAMPMPACALRLLVVAVIASVAMGTTVLAQARPAGSGATLFEGEQRVVIKSTGKAGTYQIAAGMTKASAAAVFEVAVDDRSTAATELKAGRRTRGVHRSGRVRDRAGHERGDRSAEAVLRYLRRAGAAATNLEPFRPWSAGPADARKVDGWNRPFLALGGAYERAFQDFLALLVTDKHPVAKPTDPRWDQAIATQPARSPEKAAAMARRIASV